MKKERVNEIYGVFFMLVGLFLLISILFFNPADNTFYTSNPNQPVQNPAGVIGAFAAHFLVLLLGFSAYSVPLLLLFWSTCFFMQKVPNQKLVEIIGIAVAIFSFASISSLLIRGAWKVQAGGLVGYFFSSILERYFGLAGGFIIAFFCLLLATLLFTDFLLYPIFERFWNALMTWIDAQKVQKAVRRQNKCEKTPAKLFAAKPPVAADEPKSKLPSIPIKLKQYTPSFSSQAAPRIRNEETEEASEKTLSESKRDREKPVKEKIEIPKSKEEREEEEVRLKLTSESQKIQEERKYQLPPFDLLNVPPKTAVRSADDLHANSRILEETLAEFGIEIKVVEIEQGPVVTRYEILPAPGVKVNRILSFSDDLAMALKAPSIRFIAPIPGKSAIGIEVPNSVTMKVYLRELLESKEYREHRQRLPLALGKDTSGKPMFSDLTEMPHLLIAGTTGSGKTVCVNSIIAGLLYSKLPHELKFVMVDPKMVELAVYNKLPHMLTPVVTNVRKAAATLNWVVSEMERRYRFFAVCATRNIHAFNTRKTTPEASDSEEKIPEQLPYIVVVIDELADLMLVAQDKVEGAITRLAQLSRAVGIHLILATQRPSVDVITGVIKANFPARISFKVASKVDSRTVLDINGADKLIGKGDMLFLEPGREKPVRGQAPFVSDEEINSVVMNLAAQGAPQFHEEIRAIQEGRAGKVFEEKDELYDEALRIVIETRQASTSVLQRRLHLGYGRAARIIDMMEQVGIVSPLHGGKNREVLVDKVDKNEDVTNAA